MFYECKQLKSLDLSNWDVSKIEDMDYMFYNCKQLESVGNLSDWDVSKVKDLSLMFYNCKNLKTVGDLSNWVVSGVKYHMFEKSAITNVPDWYKE
jgi:surface protein